MKDAKGHGSNARNGSGQFQSSTGISAAAKERVALRILADARRFAPTRTSIRDIPPPAMYPSLNPNQRGQRTDMPHMNGVDAATVGKTLAQVSAMGATQATIKQGS
jgi:hypothetical protein